MMRNKNISLLIILILFFFNLSCARKKKSKGGVIYLDKTSEEMAKRKQHQYGKITEDSLTAFYYVKSSTKNDIAKQDQKARDQLTDVSTSTQNIEKSDKNIFQQKSDKTKTPKLQAFEYIVSNKPSRKATEREKTTARDSNAKTKHSSDTKAQIGKASYYADKFHGKQTASGEPYDRDKLTAAHRTLPFGTMCKVTNVANGKIVRVKINDRGPYSKARIIDLSYKAMKLLDGINAGVINVKVEVVK